MPETPLLKTVRQMRRSLGRADVSGLTDAQLVERFAAQHDEAAFELLVWRHQQLVFDVCRRVLRPTDALALYMAIALTTNMLLASPAVANLASSARSAAEP